MEPSWLTHAARDAMTPACYVWRRLDGTLCDVTFVRCPECATVNRVVDCARFACRACGRIARTAEQRHPKED